jgi:hypothetical protein
LPAPDLAKAGGAEHGVVKVSRAQYDAWLAAVERVIALDLLPQTLHAKRIFQWFDFSPRVVHAVKY